MAKVDISLPDPDEYPSNAFPTPNPNARKPERPAEITSVVTGDVKRGKPSFGKLFLRSMSGNSGMGLGEYLLTEVAVPTLRNALFGLISGGGAALMEGFERALFGDIKATRRGFTNTWTNRVPYDRVSYVGVNSVPIGPASPSYSNRPNNLDEITFASKADAQAVLDSMADMIYAYNWCSVGAFYELCGERPEPVDENWGWTNLSAARPKLAGRRWYLDLPAVQPYK